MEKGRGDYIMPAVKVKKSIIVILWEHELRIAAKALHKLQTEDATKEDFSNAIKACYSAIYHPDLIDDNNPVTIMSAHQTNET